MSNDFDYISATSLRKLIAGKQISPVELVERGLAAWHPPQALGLPRLGLVDGNSGRR
jgi:hypothetical protein